ncbi:hypothetical protein [uncultured Paracoccus sp.]|uniref:hypothetical protein n=1 Tax=uncultured Paracoccus sp. TaxID=189685 RepID=UPI002611FF19|nr:hypothetical protein [uncultured Paracoccus sp.]
MAPPVRTIAGENYLLRRIVESEERFYFVAGPKIAIARMSVGYGPVHTPYEVNSRAVESSGRIPSIATTQEALRDQYFEHEARWLAPWGSDWLPQDYDLDGDLDANLSPFSPPQVFKGAGPRVNAWAIHAERFAYKGDADAKMLGLAVFTRQVDGPLFKVYPDGFKTTDVIGTTPGPMERVWNWLTE